MSISDLPSIEQKLEKINELIKQGNYSPDVIQKLKQYYEELLKQKNAIIEELNKQEKKKIAEQMNFNEEEIKKMPGDLYLKMTVLPLLHNALNMCEIVRPSDPIAFISNFMLINKGTTKTMENLIKELPKNIENEEIDQDLLLAAGEYSREERNEEAEQQANNEEEHKDNGEIQN